MPGWSEIAPLQRLLKEVASLSKEPSDHGVRKAVTLAERMVGAEALFLKKNSMLEPIRIMAQRGNFSYLAHEYINEDWHPMYHADVARELAAAKLVYVGSARLTDNFPGLTLSPAQREILDEIAPGEIRETLKDYFWPRTFRKDVFLRGARRLPGALRSEMVRQLRVALIVPRSLATLRLEVPLGKADLEPRTYEPMLDALAEAPQTIGRLIELGQGRVQPVEVLGLLMGSGQVLPVTQAEPPADAARRFNRMFAAQARFEELNRGIALASPMLGTGIAASVVHLIVYLLLSQDRSVPVEALARAVWEPIAGRGEKLLHDGKPVETEEEALAVLRERTGAIAKEMLPLWEKLRVI
jgi:hypothetical protein